MDGYGLDGWMIDGDGWMDRIDNSFELIYFSGYCRWLTSKRDVRSTPHGWILLISQRSVGKYKKRDSSS